MYFESKSFYNKSYYSFTIISKSKIIKINSSNKIKI